MRSFFLIIAVVFFQISIPSVFAKSLDAVVVPNVIGLKAGEAQAKLESKGFQVEIVFNSPASSEEDAFNVYEQSVPPDMKVKRGQKITLAAFGDFIPQRTDGQKRMDGKEGKDSLDNLFGDIEDLQKKIDRKKVESEQQNETSGQSIRGDELPPEKMKSKAKQGAQ